MPEGGKPYDVSARFKEVARRAGEQRAAKPAEQPPPRPPVDTKPAGSLPDLPPTPASIRPHDRPQAPDRGEAIRRLMASLTR